MHCNVMYCCGCVVVGCRVMHCYVMYCCGVLCDALQL